MAQEYIVGSQRQGYENVTMDVNTSNLIGDKPFYSRFPPIREIQMPQKVICSECAHILYQGDTLKSPQEIAKKTEGRCPSCNKILKAIYESLSIYPYEE